MAKVVVNAPKKSFPITKDDVDTETGMEKPINGHQRGRE
jgi:hypothetical protein